MAMAQVSNNRKYFKYIQRKYVVSFFSYHLGSAAFLSESISEKQRVCGHKCVAPGLEEEHWRPDSSYCECGSSITIPGEKDSPCSPIKCSKDVTMTTAAWAA